MKYKNKSPINRNNILFYLLLIILSNIGYSEQNKIVFPFKTEVESNPSSNYIDILSQNKIYIEGELGFPVQKINLYLTMETSYLIISDSSIDISFYNSKKSSSYKNISELTDFYFELFTKGYYAKDNFLFRLSLEKDNKHNFNNIEFIHALEYSKSIPILSGYFGLQLPKKNKPNIYNLLKKEKIISEEYWTMKYTSDDEGYFLIGEYPSEYEDEKGVRTTNSLPCSDENTDLCWYLKFNDIKFGEINVNRDRTAKISPELGYIVGTGEYQQKISENFFDKLGNKCQKKLSDLNYYYYECDKNIDISNFKNLEFSHSDLMYNFIMTKDDLFKEYNDKIYFLIIFSMYSPYGSNWKLGKPFIKKYNFGYNTDKKKIYFFYKEEENKKQTEKNITYYIIIGILGLGVILMVIVVILNKFLKPKRKKASELQEEINASTNENDENKNSLGV